MRFDEAVRQLMDVQRAKLPEAHRLRHLLAVIVKATQALKEIIQQKPSKEGLKKVVASLAALGACAGLMMETLRCEVNDVKESP